MAPNHTKRSIAWTFHKLCPTLIYKSTRGIAGLNAKFERPELGFSKENWGSQRWQVLVDVPWNQKRGWTTFVFFWHWYVLNTSFFLVLLQGLPNKSPRTYNYIYIYILEREQGKFLNKARRQPLKRLVWPLRPTPVPTVMADRPEKNAPKASEHLIS